MGWKFSPPVSPGMPDRKQAAFRVFPMQLQGCLLYTSGIGHTSSAIELAQWYTTADCLVNPTLEDNMPMVNLEALACGTPVAVFRTGGCPEAVDETCGIVVEQGDTEELCSAVRTLCERKTDMTAACLKRAEQFDSGKTFEQYSALYEELCPGTFCSGPCCTRRRLRCLSLIHIYMCIRDRDRRGGSAGCAGRRW